MLIPVTNESDSQVLELRRRLDEFYSSTQDYVAFNEDLPKPEYWSPIVSRIREVVARKGECRVLEFGAGRSGFGVYLADTRRDVVWDVQDVTPTNKDYLASVADHVFIGDICSISDEYDIIFSTFVWEHVSNPRETLAHLLRLLEKDGTLYIASPRYDLPFYIPPSIRHHSARHKVLIGVWLMAQRLRARWSPSARFLIHLEPAVLSRAWYRDADAIHWPSLNDLQYSVPRNFSIHRVLPEAKGDPSALQRFFWQFMLLFVEIRRRA